MRTHRDRWPISHVLTGFYTVSAALILLLATGFLYRVMERGLERNNSHALADQVEVLRSILRDKPDDLEALRAEVQTEGAARRFAMYYGRILDGQGHVIIATSEMDKQVPPEAFNILGDAGRQHDHGRRWESPAGRWFLLMAATSESADPKAFRAIQLALDVTQDEAALAGFRRMLILVLILGVVGSAIAGGVIARRGMRPLEEIAETARRITATHLNERISSTGWPKELRALAQAFDDMLERLEGSFQRLSQFSADLAHEFRTPIAALRVEAEVALQRSRSVEEYQHTLHSILEEFEHLSRMVESLLFIARTENSEMQMEPSAFAAEPVVREVCSLYDAAIADKGIHLRIDGGCYLYADSTLFRRVINNVVSNAIQFTGSGGSITITFRETGTGYTEVRVQDTGCGIAAEHLPKLFDRFYQADKSRSSSGTGLGLAIVKSIMEMHGGKVAVESQVGTGTVVTLQFKNRQVPAQA